MCFIAMTSEETQDGGGGISYIFGVVLFVRMMSLVSKREYEFYFPRRTEA